MDGDLHVDVAPSLVVLHKLCVALLLPMQTPQGPWATKHMIALYYQLQNILDVDKAPLRGSRLPP
jgi:hypothetical protein